jgi:catalase
MLFVIASFDAVRRFPWQASEASNTPSRDAHNQPGHSDQRQPEFAQGGARGPSLLEDFILREKITHFDHERIPERVVHARGAAAHGHFQVYEPLSQLTVEIDPD